MTLCACGCGQTTPIAKHTRPHLGHVEGEPTRYARGHSSRLVAGRYPNSDEVQRGRGVARELFPLDGALCEAGCGRPALDHHHVDGDTSNNDRANVQLLCRRCHMELDGRLEMSRKPPWDRGSG